MEIICKCMRCGKPLCILNLIKNSCEDHPIICQTCKSNYTDCGSTWKDMKTSWKKTRPIKNKKEQNSPACSFSEEKLR